jgi:hypothetical protein
MAQQGAVFKHRWLRMMSQGETARAWSLYSMFDVFSRQLG